MNYIDSVIKETKESQKEWEERISKKKKKLQRKYPDCKIITIILMGTVHLYKEVKK